MRIHSKETLGRYMKASPQASDAISAWIWRVEVADWSTPHNIKQVFASASILKNSHVVFNIQGNQLRLVAAILYKAKAVLVKFIGTHDEYDDIDALTVDQKKWRGKSGH